MSSFNSTIAVTGLNATDNPGPGVAVIRSLRADPEFHGRIIGLAYDSLEPGIYAADLADDVFLIPYPSQGSEALAARLTEIQKRAGLDVVIPTLDAELPLFISLEAQLADMKVGTFLPTRDQLDLRSKAHLAALRGKVEIPVPATKVINDASELYEIHREISYPFFLKGLYYGAYRATSVDEAVHAFYRVVAQWGLPVIVQEEVRGDELDVVAVGDGRGGLVGAVAMRKTFLTDKGKGWAGIAIHDPVLMRLTEQLMGALRWRGPCEVEVVATKDGGYHLLEVNPRFPAWVYLSAGAGINLPSAVARLAAGHEVKPMRDYRVGTMFVRISLDQIASLEDFERITTYGELRRSAGSAQ